MAETWWGMEIYKKCRTRSLPDAGIQVKSSREYRVKRKRVGQMRSAVGVGRRWG